MLTLDAKILEALRDAGEHAVSGPDLARAAGISVGALGHRMKELRTLGYEIEASPHRGYRLRRAPDLLHADDLLSRLGQVNVIGREIRVFQETTSTNDVVDRLARGGAKEGAVVFAEAQTRGRGRLGRSWVSPRGKGLWFSILLRPTIRLEFVTRLTIAAATAVSRAIAQQTDLRPEIKWPNDILISGKKVAGILTELSGELDRVKHVILGIGVNVNLEADDFPPEIRTFASSLRLQLERLVDRSALAAAALRALDEDYARALDGRFEELADEWQSQCSTLGREVTIQMGARRVRGRAESLDLNGALLLRTHHGRLERISAGDVTLQPSS